LCACCPSRTFWIAGRRIVEILGGLPVQMGGLGRYVSVLRGHSSVGVVVVWRFGFISGIVERFLEFHNCQ
jgi:hypothetical protein